MNRTVHIIDCGLGNIMSVHNAFEKIGSTVVVAGQPAALEGAEHIVLPGVGAFGNGMDRLRDSGFDKAIPAALRAGARLLGICLGMQLLFDRSFEFGEHEGLHLLPGEVRGIDVRQQGLRLPHIGWNDTFFTRPEEPLVAGLDGQGCFYYVNSFACFPAQTEHIVGVYRYGGEYAGIVRMQHIVGVQFHPEKSQHAGLRLLENFMAV